jgi:photosystem II stability/assembly factor-like uncharacterized protein
MQKKNLIAASVFFLSYSIVHVAHAQAIWTLQDLNLQNSDLYSIAGFPNGLAVCVGENGVIERSTDSGKTWSLQNYGNLTLNGVASADGKHFVAVSSEGTFIASSDSGITWPPSPEVGFASMNAVDAGDSSSFIAVGNSGASDETIAFGMFWFVGASARAYNMNAVVALSGSIQNAVVCGDSGSIQLSKDFEGIWDSVGSGTTANLRHIAMTPDGRMFAYGDEWAVVTSTDTGKTWQNIEIDSLNSSKYPSASVRNIVFFSPTHGFAFVAQQSQGLLNDYVTVDGGRTWEAINIFDYNDDDDAAVAIDTMRGIKVGQDGGIYLTSNQGMSWAEVNEQVSTNYTHLAFSSPTNGFVATNGASNEIERTTDAGNGWSKVFSAPSTINGIVFPNPGIGYAYGEGFVSRTVDSGASWSTITSTSVGNVLWMSFSSSAEGILLTSSDSLLSTSDSGTSWQPLQGPPSHPTGLVSTALFGSDTILVLGTRKVFRSLDGGVVWDSSNLPYPGKTMRFSGPSHGWIVGSGMQSEQPVGAVILNSSDCGASWGLQLADTNDIREGLSDIAIANGDHAITTGYFTLGRKPPIFETSDGGNTWTLDTMERIAPPQNVTGPQNFCGIAFPSANSAYMLTEAGDFYSGMFATSGVGIQASNMGSSLYLYPNPAIGNTMTVLLPPHNESFNVSVWDQTGRLRLELPAIFENQATVPMGLLPAGPYYLTVIGNNFSENVPFLRQK